MRLTISSLPDSALIQLTTELLHAGATNQHGFTNRQLKILGVERRRGWLKDLVGTQIPAATYQAFLDANPKASATGHQRRRRKPKSRAHHTRRVMATPFRDIPPSDGSMPWEQ